MRTQQRPAELGYGTTDSNSNFNTLTKCLCRYVKYLLKVWLEVYDLIRLINRYEVRGTINARIDSVRKILYTIFNDYLSIYGCSVSEPSCIYLIENWNTLDFTTGKLSPHNPFTKTPRITSSHTLAFWKVQASIFTVLREKVKTI